MAAAAPVRAPDAVLPAGHNDRSGTVAAAGFFAGKKEGMCPPEGLQERVCRRRGEKTGSFQLHLPVTGISVERPQFTTVFSVPLFKMNR